LFAARPQLGLKRGTRLSTIPGQVPDLSNWPSACAFADRCAHAYNMARRAHSSGTPSSPSINVKPALL